MIPAQTTADQAPPRAAQAIAALRMRWALLTAVVGGLLLAAAFPPVGVWPLVAACPALLVVALAGRGVRASLCVGLAFGAAFFFPLLFWTVNVAWYAWVALAAASTVIFGVLAIGQRLLLRLPGWPLAVAGWWVAAEAVRDRWPWGGFPWGRLAMSQAGAPTQGWVAIGGPPLLTFFVALVGATLGWLVLTGGAARRRSVQRAPRRRPIALAAAALAATAGLAALPGLLSLDPVPADSPTAEVAAIQGDVPRARSLATQLNDSIVTSNHVDATQALARKVAAGQGARTGLGDLAGELHGHRPDPGPPALRGNLQCRRHHQPANPGRCRTPEPGAQREPPLAARQGTGGRVRQAKARAVR